MKNHFLATTLLATACVSLFAGAANAAPLKPNETEQQVFKNSEVKVKLGTGFDYSTGDYGQTKDTEVWYVPVSGKVEMDKWAFKLTVPWLSIKGPGAVIGGGGGGVVTSGSGTVTTQSGLGDIVSALTYTADVAPQTYLDLTGKIKFPTADKDKGLGTGEEDYTLQADLSKQINAVLLFAGAGYKFVGSNNTLNLDNIWLANVGIGYDFTKNINAGLTYDWREAASKNAENPSEATAYVNFKVTPQTNIQLYGLAGFSDGSPNAGGGAVLGYRF